ncbi:hypothetical protein HMPREF9212_0216 [Lactobacillus iners LactinV 03V1-b]|nr:hypothetical protein HMPREF9212_0216 [Lactobacillus iners LactinV 03V1-b]
MQDKLDRQYSQLISYEDARKKFQRYLAIMRAGATKVYQVASFPINNKEGLKKALNTVSQGSVVWQHTDKWHTAGIYIRQGYGFKFNRGVINLVAHGIKDEESFQKIWTEQNGDYDYGIFPKSPGSYTSQVRKQQPSYIVCDLNTPENKNSKIPGGYKKNQVHRTHLISSQVTGIELHKGLLIDFDGWLNSNPMNQFETDILNLTKKQDVIWSCNVWIGQDYYLHLKYDMYDSQYNLINKAEWVDDRWTYLWFFDKGQDYLTKRIKD